MAGDAPPVFVRWQNGVFVPASATAARRAAQAFVEGQEYTFIEHEERSTKSHAHYFAAIHEAWQNLPDGMADNFPSVEHLRKYALIKSGFCTSTTLSCSSDQEARKVASFMRPLDEFGIVDVKGSIVTRYIAKSQSYRHMSKEEFQASKTAVLDVVSGLIGSSRDALETAGRAA